MNDRRGGKKGYAKAQDGGQYRVLQPANAWHASSLFLAISFALCVGFDLLFPAHPMYQAWQKPLPGFEWISWKSFFLGLVKSYGYGWYGTLICIPIYKVFSAKLGQRQ